MRINLNRAGELPRRYTPFYTLREHTLSTVLPGKNESDGKRLSCQLRRAALSRRLPCFPDRRRALT